ncbi:MAG: O-antigen ligase family protein [Alphaproteobacteria bacterium]
MINKYNLSLFKIAGFFTLLLPFCIFLGAAPTDITLSLIGLLFLINSCVKRDFKWLNERWIQLALTLWIYMVIRSFFTVSPDDALNRALPFIRYILFAAALQFWVFIDKKTRRRLLFSCIFAVTFATTDTLIQYFLGTDVFGHPWANAHRLTGPIGKPKIGIILTWMCFPVILFSVRYTLNKIAPLHGRILAAIGVISIFLTVLLSGERMAFLLMLLGLGCAILLYKRIRQRIVLITTLISICIAGVFFADQAVMTRQFDSTVKSIQSFEKTLYSRIWFSGIEMFKQNPVFGVGTKHFRRHCTAERYESAPVGSDLRNVRRCDLHPHNIYIELLAETGLIGFGLFMAILFVWARRFFIDRDHILSHASATGVVIALFIHLWPIAASASFFSSWAAAPLWLMVGWSLSYVTSSNIYIDETKKKAIE